jgi:cell division protein FtsI (penicillin-binding protein 3)
MPLPEPTRRLQRLLWLMLFWAAAIFGRLVWLQVIHHDELLKQAQRQQERTVPVQALRGAILDRTGQLLAQTLPAESVAVNPNRIPDARTAADLLSQELGLDRTQLYQRLRSAIERGSGFMWVARKIKPEQADHVRGLKLDFVEFRPELSRYYPRGTLASHVLGSMGYLGDDDFEQGNAGIEQYFNDDLAGRPGEARVLNDVRQRAYDSTVTREPVPGASLTLTIDPNIQYLAERELDKAVASSHAKTGSVVVLNPYSGDVLAMANYPRYDPNVPPSRKEPPGARSNLAVSTPFEPGSVFKVITLSAALETTNLKPTTMINCGNGSINLFGRVIHDHKAYASLSMAGVLANSSNVGAIQIALKMGQKNLYDYAVKFGFGRRTGIDLPGESPGVLRDIDDWMPTSVGSVAMGHELSTTSIQLALAGAAVANGGMLVRPRLVMARQKPGEPLETFQPAIPQRVIRPETAIQMRRMMEGVVLEGTGKGYANLKGYTSGGKTGSAQIYDKDVHAYTHHYNASFLGFAPVANPRVVIAVTLEGTSGGPAGYGGPVAAPVFREVAVNALRIMDVPKDLPEAEPSRISSTPADVDDLSIAGLGDPPAGQRSVSSVTPPPVRGGTPVSAGESSPDRRPFLTAQVRDSAIDSGPKTPDFRGMTVRAVLEESAARGVEVERVGSGLARSQNPPPGTVLPPHTPVRVEFAK